MKLFSLLALGISGSVAISVPTSKTLNYLNVAENTDEIRWYVTPGKKVDVTQSTANFSEEYEVIHAQDTWKTANTTDAFRQYYQVYTYHNKALEGWNKSLAPFTQKTPLPSEYKPMALTRHIWTSYTGLNDSFDSPGYQNNTAGHIFCRLDQYGAILTPLAVLSWDDKSLKFMDNRNITGEPGIYVGLLLGDSSDGVPHEKIYENLEVRRAYVESKLRVNPRLAKGLLNMVQSGKSLITKTNEGKVFMDRLQEHSPFLQAIFWQHIAVEEYWFKTARDATTFFTGTPELGNLIWEGSTGSYSIIGEPRLIFEKDSKQL